MALRAVRLPADLVPVADMIVESFQYPENPAWSVQTDEKEQLVNGIRNVARIWPLMRLMGSLSPSMRDIFRGHIWEEGGQIVGATILQRRGSTDVWMVGTVGVLPAYRRRGIARKLLTTSMEFMRDRGAAQAILGVIDGNLPAYKLYEDLGFEHYSGMVEFDAQIDAPGPAPELPTGYERVPLAPNDWRPRYELDDRITPQEVQRYDPVTEGRYRRPLGLRLIYPILMRAQAVRDADFTIRTEGDGQIVARGGYTVPTRGQGVNNLRMRLDPDHAELAPYLMGTLLHEVTASSPGHRLDFTVPEWMEAAVTEAEAHGLQRRVRYLMMGIEL
ncbi:MAG: GNAT family N-acetyltransferase [Anaerolineae bacterium]